MSDGPDGFLYNKKGGKVVKPDNHVSMSKRQCLECGQVKNLEDFLMKGQIHPNRRRCVACVTKIGNERREANAESSQRKSFFALARKFDQKVNKAPHVEDLAIQMIERFGGLTEFTFQWKCQLDHAIAAKPGSKMVLDAFKAIGNLVYVSSKSQVQMAPIEAMSKEEIEEELEILLSQMRTPPAGLLEAEVEPVDTGPNLAELPGELSPESGDEEPDESRPEWDEEL